MPKKYTVLCGTRKFITVFTEDGNKLVPLVNLIIIPLIWS